MKGRKPNLVAIDGGASQVPEPPDHLSEEAKEIWNTHAGDLHARGWLDRGQQEMLAHYCGVSALLKKIQKTLNEEPMSFTGAGDVPKPHPLIRQAERLYNTITRMASEIGLTIVSKARKGDMPKPPSSGDNGAPPGLDI